MLVRQNSKKKKIKYNLNKNIAIYYYKNQYIWKNILKYAI